MSLREYNSIANNINQKRRCYKNEDVKCFYLLHLKPKFLASFPEAISKYSKSEHFCFKIDYTLIMASGK